MLVDTPGLLIMPSFMPLTFRIATAGIGDRDHVGGISS